MQADERQEGKSDDAALADARATAGTRPAALADALRALIFLTVLAVFFVWGGRQVMPWNKMFPDVICYWSAAEILAAGHNPYDIALQTQVQQSHGWNRNTDGFGLYDFLPYYYPPWFGLLWVAALPLGYEGGKLAWFFINVELALVTGWLLAPFMRPLPPWVAPVLVPCFLFSIMAIALGQASMLVLFLVALTWALLAHHWDRCAGVTLAWLTIKPQLTVVLIGALLLWLLLRRRWQALLAFGLTITVVCLASTLIFPDWLPRMLQAPRQTPNPTEYYPWIGNTWFLVLRALGTHGPLLMVLYAIVGLAVLAVVLRAILRRGSELSEVVGISLLAAFFVAPYARHYDFPILLIPFLFCLGRVRPTWLAIVVLAVLAAIPYWQMSALVHLKAATVPPPHFMVEGTYFWVPTLGLLAWIMLRPGHQASTEFNAYPKSETGPLA